MEPMVPNVTQYPQLLEVYETQIDLYRQQAAAGFLGMGRTLLAAKEAKVVPHGRWESWATQQTGMSIQQVQRLMRIAREVQDGSALVQLDMSKAMLLLSSGLDEAAREQVGQEAAERTYTVRELEKRIQEVRAEAVRQTEEAMGKNVDALVTSVREEAEEAAWALVETHREEAQKELRRKVKEAEAKAAQAAEKKLQEMQANNETLREWLREAETELAAAQDNPPSDAQMDAMRQTIADLREELAAAEAREERRAAQLEMLQAERQRREMDRGFQAAIRPLGGADVAHAVGVFLGSVGVLPQMRTALHGMTAKERQLILDQAEAMSAWAAGVQAALGMVDGTQLVEIDG